MSNLTPNPYRFKDYPMLDQDAPVSASDISEEFKVNPNAARKRYQEKRMYVEGVVTYSGPDIFGLPSLELSDRADGRTDCLCVFETPVDAYKKGDHVTVLGNFIDSVPKYGPLFKKCEVVGK